jgi:hypothetical protein
MRCVYVDRFIFAIIAFSIFITLFPSQNLMAQTSTPVSPTSTAILPSPTIDPTIPALQAVVSTQEAEISSLRRDLDYEVRDMRWWFLVAGVIFAITGITGYQAYRGIGEQVRRKIRIMTNKYYYQLDVTNLDIRVKDGEHQERLIELLKSQGFYEISRFEKLGRGSFSGVTIYSVEKDTDEKSFIQHIEQHYNQVKRLNPKRAGFILYAPTGYRLKPEVIEMYPTTAVANTPWNLISTLQVLGRHVTVPPKIDNDEEEEKA